MLLIPTTMSEDLTGGSQDGLLIWKIHNIRYRNFLKNTPSGNKNQTFGGDLHPLS